MTRNWKEYNEELVKRGELLLDLDFLEKWEEELEQMNLGKEGGQYRYPESFVEFLGIFRCFTGLPCRQTEGFVKALKNFLPGLEKPDHATIHRCVTDFEPELRKDLEDREDVVIAMDASGIKVEDRGEWKGKVHGTRSRKGYLNIHIAVDAESDEVLALEVTDEQTGDSEKFESLIEKSSENASVKRALADAAYDSKNNFDLLEEREIDPGIRPRRNSSGKARGSWARRRKVRRFMKDEEEEWKEEKGYGKRWKAETFFSALKRKFGEFTRAKKFENMVREMKLKIFGYNLMLELAGG